MYHISAYNTYILSGLSVVFVKLGGAVWLLSLCNTGSLVVFWVQFLIFKNQVERHTWISSRLGTEWCKLPNVYPVYLPQKGNPWYFQGHDLFTLCELL